MTETIRHPEAAEDLLRRVASWPSIRIERDGRRATLRDRVATAVIATLDLRTGTLVVHVPPDMVNTLRDRVQPKRGAVRLDVTDVESRSMAIAVLRRRTELERFSAQYRNASP